MDPYRRRPRPGANWDVVEVESRRATGQAASVCFGGRQVEAAEQEADAAEVAERHREGGGRGRSGVGGGPGRQPGSPVAVMDAPGDGTFGQLMRVRRAKYLR